MLLGFAFTHLPQMGYPVFLLASMAASAVLLFAVPHSPLAQPWNLVGGHGLSALTGWVCILFIHQPWLAVGIAVGASIFLMHYCNCLHPPGAATALTMVLSSTQFLALGWQGILLVVTLNVLLSLCLALLINNMLSGRRYPTPTATLNTSHPTPHISLEQNDLAWALSQMDSMIDVSEHDLAEIYQHALYHAQQRNKPTR